MDTENEKIIKKYSKHRLKVERISSTTVHHQETILIKFSRTINKPLKKTTEHDIVTFLDEYNPNSKDIIITILRRFYRWLYDLEPDDKLPPCIRRIKLRNRMEKKRHGEELKYRERIITPEEYQKLIVAATSIEYKAILETLYLYGVRVSEFLSMHATDVHETDELTTITVWESKTESRDIPSTENHQYLLEWFNVYQPHKGQKDKPLWVSFSSKSKTGCLSRVGVYEIIQGIKKKAGINRKLTTHDFRHTAISRDRNRGMPDTHISDKYGLVKGSTQIAVYDHNKTKELINYLLEKPAQKRETYTAIKKEKDLMENELKKEIEDFRTELIKMNQEQTVLGVLVGELVQNVGIEGINKILRDNKKLLRKYNVHLAGDKK